MLIRNSILATITILASSLVGLSQTTQPDSTQVSGRWRPPGSAPMRALQNKQGDSLTVRETSNTERSGARVTKGSGTLPNDHGQVWREYDISPYAVRVTTTARPQQAIVDWILRETGYEAWHSEPLGILSATKKTLRVYHTPEIQAVVADIVDRFVSSEAETQAFSLRAVTIENPNWRARALRLMKPVPVQSQGVQGWLLAKEDAALLLNELQKRNDFREHSSPHFLVHNGQSAILSSIHPRRYVRSVQLNNSAFPEPQLGQVDEGYALEFSPLMSLDGQTVDAIIKFQLSQVEKLLPVMLEVPTTIAPRQRTRIEVPQITMCNVHERFRWPSNQVLLLSMGVIATPSPAKSSNPLDALPLPKTPSRADALLFIECKGKVARELVNGQPRTASGAYPQRY